MKTRRGFTIIELIFAIVIALGASILFFVQKQAIEVQAQDNTKKTAINAMYYSLEEVYYPTNKFYPRSISSDNLKSMDPKLFTDPSGNKLGTAGSAYTYSPTDCNGEQCKSYTLKAILSNEADYVKTSRNK